MDIGHPIKRYTATTTNDQAAETYKPQALRPGEDAATVLPSVGAISGEIIGWRAWRVHKGLLGSMSRDIFWVPKRPMFRDFWGESPMTGAYAWKDPELALNFLKECSCVESH